MYKKRMLLCLSGCLFFFSACGDRKDPEDREYILAAGVDTAEDGYSFTLAPADVEEGTREAYRADSVSFAKAAAETDRFSSRKTDLGQLKTVILSRELLSDEKRLSGLLEELERERSISKKVLLLGTEEKAADCVSAIGKRDGGLFLWDFYKNTAEEAAVTKALDLDTLLAERAEGDGAVFPLISFTEEGLRIGGGLAVCGGKTALLKGAAERGSLFLVGEGKGVLLEGKLPLRVRKSKTEYSFFRRGEKLCCILTVKAEGELSGSGGKAEERRAERFFERVIRREAERALSETAECGDVFGILTEAYRQSPALLRGKTRAELWQELEISVRPEVRLRTLERKTENQFKI